MERPSPSDCVRQTAQFISSLPESAVTVDPTACAQAAAFLAPVLARQPRTPTSISASWCNANGLHPAAPTPDSLNWIFLIDTLNFCFWANPPDPAFTVSYRNRSYSGYWALCASVNRALDDDIPITTPSFYASVSLSTLSHIFRPSTHVAIPLISERLQVLHETANILIDKFSGSVHNLVASANGSAQALLHTLVSTFPSYNDSFPFPKNLSPPSASLTRLCFYKRAQILIADIWACFASSPLYSFHDISSLTMFPDYRVPQILAWLGAIRYSPSLLATLKSHTPLRSGFEPELQIRACSVQAVELIRRHLESSTLTHPPATSPQIPINSILIDYALWDYATQHRGQLAHIPIHRVKSIFY